MSQINPFAHVVYQSVEAQRRGAIEKERQLRRQRTLQKNIAADDEALEHQVESAEEIQPVGDEAEQQEQQRQRPRRRLRGDKDRDDDDKPHIDLTA